MALSRFRWAGAGCGVCWGLYGALLHPSLLWRASVRAASHSFLLPPSRAAPKPKRQRLEAVKKLNFGADDELVPDVLQDAATFVPGPEALGAPQAARLAGSPGSFIAAPLSPHRVSLREPCGSALGWGLSAPRLAPR